jgi:pimeloyl-ACP methyl ester carboxylesterase
MPFVNALGVDVHYVERGPSGDAGQHTLVLLHGFTIDHRSNLAAVEPAFARRPSWHRIYLDFPGMGQTKAPGWVQSTDDVFRVTEAAIAKLVPGPYAVAGGSFGGYVGLGLAAADPARVEGLGLFVPMVIPQHEQRTLPGRQALVIDVDVQGLDAELVEQAVVLTPETLRRTVGEITVALPLGDDAAIERIWSSYAGTFPLLPSSGTYDGPSLVLLGRQDNVVGYRDQWALLSHLPRATVVVADRAGHNLPIEQPTLFTALVGEWLDRVAEAGSVNRR